MKITVKLRKIERVPEDLRKKVDAIRRRISRKPTDCPLQGSS